MEEFFFAPRHKIWISSKGGGIFLEIGIFSRGCPSPGNYSANKHCYRFVRAL
jgi:hypothetical protein